MSHLDLNKPIEIEDNIFWVGHYLEDDIFQCHSYLIRDSEESVLIDPGSLITFNHTLKKINQLTKLSKIKYIICHHQDPDITASLPQIEKVFPKGERHIITHWRTYFLLKHYNLMTPFYLVDQHDFKLSLRGGRTLHFILTPYMHFPGSIVTYDTKTKVLFSSDIFGGWVEENWSLFAKDEDYLENIRSFHEIYMPSKDIVISTLENLKKLDIKLILPQHGSIIKGREFVKKTIWALENFDYGKMFEAKSFEAFKIMSQKARIISLVKELILKKTFMSEILTILKDHLSYILPIKDITVFIKSKSNNIYRYSKDYRYIPRRTTTLQFKKKNSILYKDRGTFIEIEFDKCSSINDIKKEEKEFLEPIVDSIFCVANREKNILHIQETKKSIKKKIYIDTVTGLYRRELLNDILHREIYTSKRYGYHFSVLMLDIDDFKNINDSYGHQVGDRVLKAIASSILKGLRKSDIAIRYGGEEFLIILPYTDMENAKIVAEKIRKKIEELDIDGIKVTISIGIADNTSSSGLNELIKRADESLYIAKKRGKNRIVTAHYK